VEEEGPLELIVMELRERERVRGVEEEEVGVVARGCWVVMVMEGGGEERWAALLTCSHGGIKRKGGGGQGKGRHKKDETTSSRSRLFILYISCFSVSCYLSAV
jgi:hypothetical protein